MSMSFPPSVFHLEFQDDGTLVDGSTYTNLDRARDDAFGVWQDEGRRVAIMRSLNGHLFIEEVCG